MKLVKGKKAETPKGMAHNVKTMEKAGYSKKRAEGTAYGEVGMAKKARRDESKAMEKREEKKEHSTKKAVISHLKKDNKECTAENKMHNKLIKKMKKD